MMNLLLRLGCVAVYLAGLAGAAGWLPRELGAVPQAIALFVLGAHTVELLLLWPHARRYDGPLAASVALAILFGTLHWVRLLPRDDCAAASGTVRAVQAVGRLLR